MFAFVIIVFVLSN